LDQARQFFHKQHGAGIMLKAMGGGGGRGMRLVTNEHDLADAHSRCCAEALAFGVEGVYAERLMSNARHIEVQILGDGENAIALGERECTLQRRFQKLVEISPSPSLSPALRQRLTDAALSMARSVKLRSLCTFEFLVEVLNADVPYVFIEANPRLQVEHTVTEEVTGLDLVQLQTAVAAGESLQTLGLDPARPPTTRGHAIQWRINAETMNEQGWARPASGTLQRFDLPAGPGIRVDTHGVVGHLQSPHYDSLLAKLIVRSTGSKFIDAVRMSQRALAEMRIEGLATNLSLLRALAGRTDFATQNLHTQYLQNELSSLLHEAAQCIDAPGVAPPVAQTTLQVNVPEGMVALHAPMAGRLVQINVSAGERVAAGAPMVVIESMKMEHVLHAPQAACIGQWCVQSGDVLHEGQVLAVFEPIEGTTEAFQESQAQDPEEIRADLQRLRERHAFLLDSNRAQAVAKRHAQGGRTARENLADLVDENSFIEYGALAIAAQTRRRSVQDLIANTPADGLITGIGTVNANEFGSDHTRCAVMAYDYTVLAGTQGMRNHHKKDRLLSLVHQQHLPLVLFAEGGGGRPGDVDMPIVAGLNNHTFSQFAALSGKVPVVGIVHGRCFAGNAALLGCADVIIATAHSNIGMGGPAMIEGGGLGVYKPEDIGPSAVQHGNGVIDVLVSDEIQAVSTAKRYLSYFQGTSPNWGCTDQRMLRHSVPENRLRVYDMRALMIGLFDTDSVLELRRGFGTGMITALARLEGRPVGVLANDPTHLGGAIDAQAADKAARFMQLCDAHGLPIVSLTDTPGFMVGPEIEAQAQVRHVCRMFVVASHLSVPFFAVVTRKGYGLGAQAMTAGGFDAPVFTVSWPSGEFGAMGLEGSVKLGFRKELEAAAPGQARDALYRQLVAQQYENGQAMNMAATLEIDAVIDPAETRHWLMRGLRSTAPATKRGVRFIDTW
jgi:acetyl-CoA carboxylase carboxyltransferase component/biotin carboxylase